MSKVRWLAAAAIFFVISSFSLSSQKVKVQNLSEKYRDWLKLVTYIINDKEKDVFLRLDNDRDRDVFIAAFWKMRDPTPGTPENEYKDEHLKRFTEADKKFRRSSARAGWMTDMGRMYIILGPPISIERFDGDDEIYPAEIWSYYGEPGKGLPTHFSLVFFQKGGAGEYKLYDPFSDGPASLLIQSKDMDPFDYETLYERIKQDAPTLALVSLSLIPGEIPYGYQPSLQNSIILGSILESQKKMVNPTYATHFMNYKGIVTTEYLTNYVESEAAIALIQDPILGIDFLHFSVAPKSISLDYYEPKDQYYCNFRIDVSLRTGDKIIFQYGKDYPVYFPSQDVDKIRRKGIAIEDAFPLAEGDYKLSILLQNSVGKEFSVVERDVSLSEKSLTPKIIGPYLGYGLENYQSDIYLPFKVFNKRLDVDPKNTFSASDEIVFLFSLLNMNEDLWKEGEVKISVKGFKEKEPTQKSFIMKLNNYSLNKILSLNHSIPAKDLTPDYYEVNISLLKNGEIIDEKKSNFIVSLEQAMPHPMIQAKGLPLSKSFIYFYLLASQYDKINENEKAEACYRKTYELNPEYEQNVLSYANFLLKVNKPARALELIENIKENDKLKFDYYLLKGVANASLGNYEKAINYLLEGNKIYNSDTRLLNSLGLCYYKTSQNQRALDVLKASLSLNPKQEEIKKLLQEIEKSGH
jgi:GWxTD domain-containing protein